MDKSTLVNLDIHEGEKVVSALEEAGIKLRAALWMVTPEYEDGRLVIASDSLKQTDPLKDYEKVARILRKSIERVLPPILILRTTDPFIRKLKDLFGKTREDEGVRLGGQSIANRYVEFGYIYKIA